MLSLCIPHRLPIALCLNCSLCCQVSPNLRCPPAPKGGSEALGLCPQPRFQKSLFYFQNRLYRAPGRPVGWGRAEGRATATGRAASTSRTGSARRSSARPRQQGVLPPGPPQLRAEEAESLGSRWIPRGRPTLCPISTPLATRGFPGQTPSLCPLCMGSALCPQHGVLEGRHAPLH